MQCYIYQTLVFQYMQVAGIEEENMRLKAEVEWHRNYLDASSYEFDELVMLNALTKENERLIREKVNAEFSLHLLLHQKCYL